MKQLSRILTVFIVLMLVQLACGFEANLPAKTASDPTEAVLSEVIHPEALAVSQDLDTSQWVSQEDMLVTLYERVAPGVVTIRVLTDLGDGLGSGFAPAAENSLGETRPAPLPDCHFHGPYHLLK